MEPRLHIDKVEQPTCAGRPLLRRLRDLVRLDAGVSAHCRSHRPNVAPPGGSARGASACACGRPRLVQRRCTSGSARRATALSCHRPSASCSHRAGHRLTGASRSRSWALGDAATMALGRMQRARGPHPLPTAWSTPPAAKRLAAGGGWFGAGAGRAISQARRRPSGGGEPSGPPLPVAPRIASGGDPLPSGLVSPPAPSSSRRQRVHAMAAALQFAAREAPSWRRIAGARGRRRALAIRTPDDAARCHARRCPAGTVLGFARPQPRGRSRSPTSGSRDRRGRSVAPPHGERLAVSGCRQVAATTLAHPAQLGPSRPDETGLSTRSQHNHSVAQHEVHDDGVEPPSCSPTQWSPNDEDVAYRIASDLRAD